MTYPVCCLGRGLGLSSGAGFVLIGVVADHWRNDYFMDSGRAGGKNVKGNDLAFRKVNTYTKGSKRKEIGVPNHNAIKMDRSRCLFIQS